MEKRHTPKTGFPFIVDNEFDIDNYQFPELPSMFLKIDRPMGRTTSLKRILPGSSGGWLMRSVGRSKTPSISSHLKLINF
ncbi:hypothetical protein RDWZM_001449 [Blomia tropicalis]|uniref:Uncharacterized protein n=1 Tax=Blomia tropicalis TaxID=40697 RepID=A0A9Q0MCF9_BLOTA|nr:hypothetical protein RDWZM_001449 [Blomia tropicalis]